MESATTSAVPASWDDEQVFEDTEGIELVTSFDEMGLKQDLLRGISAYGLKKPLAIEQRAIMPIIQGRNVIAQGKSGTGKKSLVAITVCQLVDTSIPKVQALILTPRGLAVKIEKLISEIGEFIHIVPHAWREGPKFKEQMAKVKHGGGVHVVSACPHTAWNLIRSRILPTNALRLLVVLIDKPSSVVVIRGQFHKVFRLLPPHLQVVLVSPTLPKYVLEITSKLMTDPPVKILLKKNELNLENIKQYSVVVEREELKFDALLSVLDLVPFNKALIICNTIHQVDLLEIDFMRINKFPVSGMHRDMSKIEKDASLSEFRNGTTRVLIKTGAYAPGFDDQLEQQVSLVINYDAPFHPLRYNRRIGRRGVTIYFIASESDNKIVRDIEQCYNIHIGELPSSVVDYKMVRDMEQCYISDPMI